MALDRLGDSLSAYQICAARRVSAAEAKARCKIEAADVAVNDLLKFDAAKSLLEDAASQLGGGRAAPSRPRWPRGAETTLAATGQGDAARKAYGQAEELLCRFGINAEQAARRGAMAVRRKIFSNFGCSIAPPRRFTPGRPTFPAKGSTAT